jgi:S1-C subfamily serine protease
MQVLRFTCPSCNATYSLDENCRGKRIRCRQCQEAVTVPIAVKTAAPQPKAAGHGAIAAETTPRPARAPVSHRPDPHDREEETVAVKRQAPAGGSRWALLLILGGVGAVALLVLVAAVGVGAFFLLRSPPQAKTTETSKQVANVPIHNPGTKDENGKPGPTTSKETTKENPKVITKEDPKNGGPGGQFDPKALVKVKRATVYLKVTLNNGTTAEGTGFFAMEPGIVLTNAHVLGMLQPNSPGPRNVEIVANSGEKDELKLMALVLGVDRRHDLAVVRVQGEEKPLPAPLPVELDMTNLIELQKVYIFGFPLGAGLGKEITVSESSIASLRKDADGLLYQIQLNGGLHPGNSGGPIVDSRGVVIGVAVAGIKGTTINFAVPGEKIQGMLHGRVQDTHLGEPFVEQQKIKLPLRIALLDPLNRVREVTLEYWTGPDGPSRPTAMKAPMPVAGDSPKQTAAMKYQKGVASQDLALFELPAGQVYWLQPSFADQSGIRQWGPATAFKPSGAPPLERVAANLTINTNSQQRSLKMVSKHVFAATRGKEKFELSELMELEILEELEKNPKGDAIKLALGKSKFYTIVGDKKAPRNAIAQNAACKSIYTFQADAFGRLIQFGFITHKSKDQLVALEATEMSADVTTSYMAVGLGMPNRPVAPLEAWDAKIRMLFGGNVKKKDALDLVLKCTYEGSRTVKEKTEALIRLTGEINLVNPGNTPVFRQPTDKLTGYALFDVGSGMISKLKLAFNAEFESDGMVLSRTIDLDLARVPGNIYGIPSPGGFTTPTTDPKDNPKTDVEPQKDPGPLPGSIKAEGKKEIVLSSTIQEACAGAGGTKIIVHLLQEEKLAVIDLAQGKVVGHIPVKGSRVFFAAGKTDLMLVLPDSKIVETWNLAKLTRSASKMLPGPGVVKTLVMGANSAGPAMLLLADGTNALDRVAPYWLDPTTLDIEPVKTEGNPFFASFRDNIHVRASANGRLYGIWTSHQSPTGVGSMVFGKPISKYYYAHESAGDLLPSATGKFLCTSAGLHNSQATKIDPALGWCVAALEGDYYLCFGKLGFKEREAKTLQAKVFVYGHDTPIGTLPIENVSSDDYVTRNDFTFDKHLYFLPESGYLVTLPRLNDRVIVQRVILEPKK